jgi:hypothetical protein
MNIITVRDNLQNTIAGKEQLLKSLKEVLSQDSKQMHQVPDGERMAGEASIEYMILNLAELRNILADVEKCIAKDIERGWRENPDRMGGQFTDDEINGNNWI